MVDFTFLHTFTKGDPQKMRRYISLYLESAPKTLEAMRRNLEDGDWEQLRINAHSLKPQADFMGIADLKAELIRIEEAVKTKRLDSVGQMLQASLDLSARSEVFLKEMLDQL
jgi:HPt (histidine-containing phosphotransfer) domain-containing protein